MLETPVVIPVSAITGQLDNDDPLYIPGDPTTYLTLALAYDSLAGPASVVDGAGVSAPDFTHMQPRLAASWHQDAGVDWVVTLKRGISSHFGNPLSSDDIVWGFAKAFATHNIGSWRWGQVAGLTGPDAVVAEADDRIRYSLRARNPHFPSYLFFATPNVVDRQAVRSHADDSDPWGIAWLHQQVAGFGPYNLVEHGTDHVAFESRPNYWQGEPAVRLVRLQRVTSRSEGLRLLSSSEPSLVAGLTPDETAHALDLDGVRVCQTWAGHLSVEIDFLTPPLNDIRVRQALSYATPYEEVISLGLLGLGRPWRSPIKGISAWYTEQFWHYQTDPDAARALLRDAGHGAGITLDCYVPNRPDCVRVGEILQRAYRTVGVDIVLRDILEAPAGWMPPLHIRTECGHNLSEPLYDLAHDFAAIDPIWPAPGGPVGVGTWRPRYLRNESVLDMYREALLESDADRRENRVHEIQRNLLDFASSIYLAEVQQVLAANDRVPRSFYSPDTRLFHVVQYQNSASGYLPPS